MADSHWDTGFFTWTREAQIVLHPDGVVVAWNPTAANLLQIRAEDARGRSLYALLPELGELLPPNPSASTDRWSRRRLRLPDATTLIADIAVRWHAGQWLVLLTDRRELDAVEQAALALEQRYRALADALPVVIATVSLRDDDFTVLYQNARGNEYYGWSEAEWVRDPDFTMKITHPDDRARMAAFQTQIRASKTSYETEYRIVRPDGSIMWVWDMATTVYDEAGQPDYWIGCLLDITARKVAELALRDAYEQIRALSESKSEYLSFLSHEFRTPLTSIRGYSELIVSGALPAEELVEFATVIQTNAERLARMITDLLDIDRLESGLRPVRLEEIHLASLLHEVGEVIAGLEHSQTITLTLAEDLPVINADGDLLMQVMTNLLGNAIKYTPQGGEISIEATSKGPDFIELAVTDSGPGIPPDAVDTIFHRFARLPRDERRQIEGSGLGLPIARQIAEIHAGQLWAENVPRGARFVLRLPVAGPDG